MLVVDSRSSLFAKYLGYSLGELLEPPVSDRDVWGSLTRAIPYYKSASLLTPREISLD